MPEAEASEAGDVWTWTAIDADTKLVPFFVGGRDAGSANLFLKDLAGRLMHRVQLTSDGHKAYLQVVEQAFGDHIDYDMLVKMYGNASEPVGRYSLAQCTSCITLSVTGDPNKKHISTSFAGRQNLTMRMSMRRFTRLTNAFSKKVENHYYALVLYFMYYNFVRIHKTLKVTSAMETDVAIKLWDPKDVIEMIDAYQA